MSTSRFRKFHKALANVWRQFCQAFIVGLFMTGLIFFAVGFHNMDNGQNLRYVNGLLADDNITFSEYSSQGRELTAPECYILGFNQALIGGLILFALAFQHVIIITKA